MTADILTDPGRRAHFNARVLADCLSEATATFWHRRAQALLDAAPRPGDYVGRATAAEFTETLSAPAFSSSLAHSRQPERVA